MKRNNLLTAGILVVLVVVGGWTGWWFFLTTYAERTLAGMADGRPTLTYAATERFGFPFEIGIRLIEPRATTPWGAGLAVASAPIAVLRTRPWRPDAIQFALPEGVAYLARETASGQPAIAGEARTATGVATARDGGRVTAMLAAIVVRPSGAAPITAENGRIDWSLRPPGAQVFDIALADIALDEAALFGPIAKRAEARLVATGPLPLSGGPRAIETWRAAGGKVEIESARVEWGALKASGAGVVGLDDAYRLAGGVDIALEDAVDTISRLEDLKLLTREAAAAAKTLAAFASLGGGGVAKAPLTFADGEASVAGFAIARLLPVCACR